MVFSNLLIDNIDECVSKMPGYCDVTASYDRTTKLLESYRLNLQARGLSAVRDMIFEDIRRFSELGALAYVADIRKALFRLEAETLRLSYSPAAGDF